MEIQQIIIEAIEHYQDLFLTDYPFEKCDTVFVPEFNWGAMENSGCVTYNEMYLFKEEVSDQMRLKRAHTITHELGHMWFGNLVTMQWWNDLWLNESFADFICYLCLTKFTLKEPLGDSWVDFNISK